MEDFPEKSTLKVNTLPESVLVSSEPLLLLAEMLKVVFTELP